MLWKIDMLIAHIDGATRHFGAPENWDGDLAKCNVLPVRDVISSELPFMISAWEPTPAEIQAMINGATVKLWIQGTIHPVVSLTVGDVE